MARKSGKPKAGVAKAARKGRPRAAGLKTAAAKRRKAAAGASTRRPRAAGLKRSATKKRKSAARKAVETRHSTLPAQVPGGAAEPIEIETFTAEVLTITDDEV
jgi:hypothetical protein